MLLLVIAPLLIDRMSRAVQIFHELLESYKVRTEHALHLISFRDVDFSLIGSEPRRSLVYYAPPIWDPRGV